MCYPSQKKNIDMCKDIDVAHGNQGYRAITFILDQVR